jgi:LPS export ABC transporter protein LptC
VKNKSKIPKSINVKISKTGIDVSIKKLHLVEEENGAKQWELNADKAEVINSKGITRLTTIHLNLFQKKGKDILISADSGIIKNDHKFVDLTGNVEVINHGEYTLKTENLKWFSEKKTIQIDSDVEINGKDININGKGMTVNMDNKTAEVYGGVRFLYYR